MNIFSYLINRVSLRTERFIVLGVGIILYAPRISNGKGILYCHGGFEAFDESNIDHSKYFAYCGYTVVTIVYPQDGIKYSEMDLTKDVFAAQIAFDFLHKRVKQIFLMGVSRGGFVALHTAVCIQNHARGVVVVASPVEWEIFSKNTVIPKDVMEKVKNYFSDSLLEERYYKCFFGTAVLGVQGGMDKVVPITPLAWFLENLEKRGVTVTQQLYLDYGHNLFAKEDVRNGIREWLDSHSKEWKD